jgi:phosphopantetheinyl transferase (holo-ACP synthase)
LLKKENKLFIGNDIIALNESFNSRSFSNTRYYNKISDIAERELLSIVGHDSSAILWSLKESAYKVICKLCSPVPFNPKHFRLLDIAEKNLFWDSKIEYVNGKIVLSGKSFVCSNYIHSWVMPFEQDQLKLKSKVIAFGTTDKEQNSREIKHILKNELANFFGMSSKQIIISKNQYEIPYVIFEGEFLPDISLSHDGEYAAYAFVYS